MNLFRCTHDELAAQLVNNPRIYNNALVFMQSLRGSNVFQSELEKSLDDNLSFLERANEIARNSDYYVFEVLLCSPYHQDLYSRMESCLLDHHQVKQPLHQE